MRVDSATFAGAAPVHFRQSEARRYNDWRHFSVPSPGNVVSQDGLERFRSALADFVTMCRAEQLSTDALATRFEAFLATYDA
jgi:hypothetical protein